MSEVKASPGLTVTAGALTKMGCALMGSDEGAKAVALVETVLARAPDNPELAAAARAVLSHNIPRWHGAMLCDDRRNLAFEAAIRRAVRPGDRVLDIGTGSGLLAMIAARAGAGSILACEAHQAVAATARDIVAANGLADIVQVVARKSTDLDRGADLAGGADLIIAEVFADDLLSENALATLGHARRHLAGPKVRMIPQAASIRVALAWHDGSARLPPIATALGFDVSMFERHLPASYPVKVADRRLHLRSPAVDLFAFDFESGGRFTGERTQRRLRADGAANGVAQWLRLQLDEHGAYENSPDPDAPSHWAAVFYPFPGERSAEAGEEVIVHAMHDTERVQIWFA